MENEANETNETNEANETGGVSKTKDKVSKSTKIILAIVAILLPTVVVLAYFNREQMLERIAYHVDGSFRVISGEEYRHISLEDLVNLSPEAVTSSPRGEQRNFTGVPLATVLDFLEIDYSQAMSLTFFSIDGFVTAISVEEALNKENSFIVFEEDHQFFGQRGGFWEEAPFMLVMAQDPFPNRWARYIFEIVLQE